MQRYLKGLLARRSTKVDQWMYPVVIRQARYGGVYEGGEWIATINTPDTLDSDMLAYLCGDDDDAAALFFTTKSAYIGRGDTPNAAYLDLTRRVAKLRFRHGNS